MNFAKWISFTVFVIFIYVLWQIKQLLLLILTSVVLALSLNLLVHKLTGFGLKRNYAVFISFLALLALLTTFLILVVPPLISQFQQLTNLVPEGINKLIIELNKIKDNLSPTLTNSLPNWQQLLSQLQPIINNLFSRGVSFISGFLGNLLSSLLLFALTLMILVEPFSYRFGFIRLFPNFYRTRINQILSLIEHHLQAWLIDTFLKIISVIILTSISLFFLNIPLVAAQSFLAGLLTLIPYSGSIISLISPLAIAFLNEPTKAWLLIFLYITIYQIIEYIIIRKFRLKKRLILEPFNILIGQIFFTSLFGFFGLFLSTPLTIISQILIQEILIQDILDPWRLNND